MELVSVLYDFEYTAKDGRLVSIKASEIYTLLSRTNEHWWHVRKDLQTRPIYVPAQYVKKVPSPSTDSSGSNKLESPETEQKKVDVVDIKTAKTFNRDSLKEKYRFSTFGLCDDIPDVKLCVTPIKGLDHVKPNNTSAPPKTDVLELYAKPHPVPKVRNGKTKSESSQEDVKTQPTQTFLQDEDMDFPLPPDSPIYDTIPEITIHEIESLPELPAPAASHDTLKLDLNHTEGAAPSSASAPLQQVENESLRSAVYVNVAQLRKSISESPSSAPSSFSPSYFDPEGWEVHVDQESGQEYYYHPSTGRTTWDNPFLDSPTELEPPPEEEPCSPSPPPSPALSPSTASPSGWTSEWEQLVDESSGRPYFYNPMSGETSWEPPEQLSPYPAQMEAMSVHRFHEDGPPPLPQEDYPAEDYPVPDPPESYSEPPLSTGPPTLPKEYTLSHVSRTIIPRANLDRTTPSGWNLTVEPSGTWVFTCEHSPDQWIKSVDDRGQTYYYLRDGSKSQWQLPEAPVAPGQSRMENGVEAESVSVIKNWRHTIGPSQLSPGPEEGRFVPTHRRNTSDYSSDSSSTGNSPETQPNVQNLEKAGILNKTKVSENGKKVRKNWTQTWTVLLGGVLTFHKDPKSAATGASNKTNQIVPEVTVDLRGATIGWASKEKSSKKNVLELKGKNGVEFLIQYDTESIINDWHKVLVDTIRQLTKFLGVILRSRLMYFRDHEEVKILIKEKMLKQEYQDHHSDEDDGDLYEKIATTEREEKVSGGIDKRRPSRPSVTHSSSSAGETDQKRVRTKLMKFLMKRPTLQSVKEKGYIRENVFGCHLATLCAQERTTVPSFVEKCIKAVERRGLDIDGLYRVSGNLAVIQKLRYKADHEELDLEDGMWEDVHVITGALKLFFRELPEPLFPFSHFNDFITAIRIPDYHTKVDCMSDLVKSLPPPNHDTMKLLFGHLCRLIQFGDDNRMTVQNVAIVFGPTLLRPETESYNLAMHMVFQNQIVEFILNEYESIFYSS